MDELVLGTIHEISEDFKILLKPLGTMDLDKLLKLPVDGLSFDGHVEIKPGLKEYPLAEILEKLGSEVGCRSPVAGLLLPVSGFRFSCELF